MNQILEKNLELIARYNPGLKDEILNFSGSQNEVELITTDSDELNLSYNKIPLHSQFGAESEAKNIWGSMENNNLSIHILFGFGIGYLFKECCKNVLGNLFVYEPNLEILQKALELNDFSDELSKNNVFVTSNIETLKRLYNQNYIYNSTSNFLTLPSYRTCLFPNEMNELIKRLEVIAGSCLLNVSALLGKGLSAITAVVKNIAPTLESVPIMELKNIYKGKTALIISAGPSLDSCIPIIKKNKDKVIIFSVGSALKTLIKNEIIPDFVNIIENIDCSAQLLGVDVSDINLILEPYTNHEIFKFNVKQRFLLPTNTYPGNRYWARLTDVDISECVVKGTVSYSALASAKILGFSKLVLVGQDLAYIDKQCYSSNASFSDLSLEFNPETNKHEIKVNDKEKFIQAFSSTDSSVTQEMVEKAANNRISQFNQSLFSVKGITGEMLPTNVDFAAYIEFFSEFAFNNKELELINTSMKGAQIDGFKNIPLESALKGLRSIKKIELPNDFKYDKNKIYNRLEKDSTALKSILEEFTLAQPYISSYENAFNSEGVFNQETGESFFQLLKLYEQINNEYQGFELYKIISLNETLEITSKLNALKTFKEDDLNVFYILLKNYFNNVGEKISIILSELIKQKEIIAL